MSAPSLIPGALVAYEPFLNASGDTNQLVVNRLNPGTNDAIRGTTTSPQTSDPTFTGDGLSFDGGDLLTLPGTAQLWGGDFTIFLTVNGSAQSNKYLYSESQSGSIFAAVRSGGGSLNSLVATFSDGTNVRSTGGTGVVLDSTPHSWAFTFVHATRSYAVYVDGARVESGTLAAILTITPTVFQIGSLTTSFFFTATIHVFDKFQRALHSNEVAGLHAYYRAQLAGVSVALPAGPDVPPQLIYADNPAIKCFGFRLAGSGSTSFWLAISAGDYFIANFSGARVSAEFSVSNLGGVSFPKVACRVDGGSWSLATLSASVLTIAFTGLSAGVHRLEVVYAALGGSSPRWDPTTTQMALMMTGLWVDEGESVSSPSLHPRLGLVYGDSIVENQYETNDSTKAIPWLLRDLIDAELDVAAFAGQGYTASITGTGGSTTFADTWDKYDSANSRLSAGAFVRPYDFIYIEHGKNAAGSAAAVTAQLEAIRGAFAGDIFVQDGAYDATNKTTITQGINDYLAAHPADAKMHIVSLGAISFSTTDGTHPDIAGSATLATAVAPHLFLAIISDGDIGGAVGVASLNFSYTLSGGAFNGSQTVTISDNGGGGTFTPSVGGSGAGSVIVTPLNGSSNFTFTYTPASVGVKTISFTNSQGWINPENIEYNVSESPSDPVCGCVSSLTILGKWDMIYVAWNSISGDESLPDPECVESLTLNKKLDAIYCAIQSLI